MTDVDEPASDRHPAGSAGDAEALDGPGEGGLRRLIWLLPLGLAIDILLSLWVSYRHVTHSVIVQVEPVWERGERLAARGQLVDHDREGVERVEVELEFADARGRRWPLGQLETVPGGGLSQGRFEVPLDAALGEGHLFVRFEGQLPGGKAVALVEDVPVGVVESRTPHEPVHTIAASVLQWADDTSEQPEGWRIELAPFGRLLAGFDNRLMVRVTDAKGAPKAVPVRVSLLSGEFAGLTGPGVVDVDSGRAEAPELFVGSSDALGLLNFSGRMDSDVIRLQVELLASEEGAQEVGSGAAPAATGSGAAPAAIPGSAPARGEGDAAVVDASDGDGSETKRPSRRFRMVSFSGGVRLGGSPTVVARGGEVELEGVGLQVQRPIYVDVHGTDGAWIDTLMPPLRSFEPARRWALPARLGEGIVHFEAYAYTNAPGQSAEVHRVLVTAPEDGDEGLSELIEAQRARLDLPREKTGFAPKIERRYLEAVEATFDDPAVRASARDWLMGSLPVEVYGPPLAITTRGREEAALEAWKHRWTVNLRWFLWGGGLAALVFATVALVQQQGRLVRETEAVLDDADVSGSLAARGDLLTRGIVMIVILGSALVLTAVMLESLVWKF